MQSEGSAAADACAHQMGMGRSRARAGCEGAGTGNTEIRQGARGRGFGKGSAAGLMHMPHHKARGIGAPSGRGAQGSQREWPPHRGANFEFHDPEEQKGGGSYCGNAKDTATRTRAIRQHLHCALAQAQDAVALGCACMFGMPIRRLLKTALRAPCHRRRRPKTHVAIATLAIQQGRRWFM